MAEHKAEDWAVVSVRAAPHVTSQEFDGESVLVDLRRGEYYGLDGVGAVLWEQLQNGTTLTEMVEAVTLRHEVDEATCLSDVAKLLDQLFAGQLIEMVPGPV